MCAHEKPFDLAYRTVHTEPPIVPSTHFMVWFLGLHKVCVKETYRPWNMAYCPNECHFLNKIYIFLYLFAFYAFLMWEDGGELTGKHWVERGEPDQQRTLRQKSNSGRRECSCAICRRNNHKAIGADKSQVLNTFFYRPLNLANSMPSAHFMSWVLCRCRRCAKLDIRPWY